MEMTTEGTRYAHSTGCACRHCIPNPPGEPTLLADSFIAYGTRRVVRRLRFTGSGWRVKFEIYRAKTGKFVKFDETSVDSWNRLAAKHALGIKVDEA